eukprot:CAMPEP_0203668884 /NCGR_PEP_ID=MMETSP0090-20130426/5400_1 /ASSEMBLY_ACC=CAM_ASM_001088 /TAXON_ID=426623 /ORGANISM="Chaetoceros affinis, Strain CCMP159" /LENGTH=672 /DNA_ID=CAMNT_0050533439 /DNA_START=292 /DNA_END=2310 /DNA_ORIENTATION=-
MTKTFGSETQRIIASMIYDDDVEVLTTFDMNRIATLTFGDEVCGEIFDVLEYTLRHPIEFTVLTIHKTLVLLRHLAIFASQKAANAVWILKPHIKPLLEYNTVLLALDNPNSILSKVQRIKGGSVDKGQPVRDSAKALFDLIDDVETFKRVRSQSEDPDSLVPVGNKEEVGFVSDEVRKAMLLDKMKKQNQVKIKSNLKTPNDQIFGAGYASKDGKTVVGAAHGIEEMLKMAEKNNVKKYSDSGKVDERQVKQKQYVQKLKHEFEQNKINSVRSLDGSSCSSPRNKAPPVADLLDFGNDEPTPEPIQPEITRTPSLPYPSSREETYILPDVGNEGNESRNNVMPPETSEAFGPKATSTSSHNEEDLLSLTLPAPTQKANGMEDTFSAMNNLSLNSDANRKTSTNPSIFDQLPTSIINDPAPSTTKSIMGSSNPGSATAISSLDMLAPMGGNFAPANNERPPTPVDSPPPLPPTDPPSKPPRSSPIPMGGMALPSLPPTAPPPEPPRSSPVPMGGTAAPSLLPTMPPQVPPPQPPELSSIPMGGVAPQTNMMANNGMAVFSPVNAAQPSSINSADPQQNMMMMMMQQQQQMMQQGMFNNGNGGDNQQAQMMQQMMMMNQQMMQQLMTMQNQPVQQQQQQYNLPQQNHDNNSGNTPPQNSTNGQIYPSSLNPFG